MLLFWRNGTQKKITFICFLLFSEVKIPRYKIGVQIVLGEIKGQGLRIASKCLWDA